MIDRRRFLLGAGGALALPAVAGCGGYRKSPDETVPQSPFDEDSTAEEVTAGLDLTGKLAVVTGCTSGIGYETLRVLAARGAYVVGTSRSFERAEQACKSVPGLTTPLELELAEPASVIDCATRINSLRGGLDMLVCNAGYRGGGNERQLIDGLEKHFVINHLGHFLLVNRLLEKLDDAEQGRIVVVASRTAYKDAPHEGIRFDDLGFARNYSDATAYGHSKLANVLFSLALGHYLADTRITSNALHPGVINTDIDRNLNPVTQFGFGLLTAISGKTVQQGAATSCFLATHPSLEAVRGKYFEDCNAVTVSGTHHLANLPMAQQLWITSEDLYEDFLIVPQRSEVRRKAGPEAP